MRKSLFIVTAYMFFCKFIPVIPYYALFLQQAKRFETSQVLVFFSLYGIGVMLFEIPCGFFADRYGVKSSIVTGHLFRLLSIIILIFSQYYEAILLTQLVLACGDALISGSEETYFFSFYHDNEQIFTEKKYSFEVFTAKLHSINWFGIALSFFTGSLCAYFTLIVPFTVTAGIYFLCIILSFLLRTVTYDKKENRKRILVMPVLHEIIHSKKLLSWALIVTLVGNSLSVAYLLIQPMMNEYRFSGTVNGALFGCATLCASCGAYFESVVFSQSERRRNIGILALFFALIICSILIAYNTSFILFFILFCLFRFIFGMFSPLLAARTNRLISTNTYRTAIISILSLASGIVQATLLLVTAHIGKASVAAKFTFLNAFMGIAFIVICYILLRTRNTKTTK